MPNVHDISAPAAAPLLTVERAGLAAFLLPVLRPGDAGSAVLNPGDVLLTPFFGWPLRVPLGGVETVERSKGFFWHAVRVETARKNKIVSGLSQIQAETLAGGLETAIIDWWRAYLEEQKEVLESVFGGFERFSDPVNYMRHSAFVDLKTAAAREIPNFPQKAPALLPESDMLRRLKAMQMFAQDPDGFRARVNAAFIDKELASSKNFFDTIEAHPLTPAQRKAVVTDEDRNLVVAAAGSGKTSVIAAKTAWLIKKGRRSPSDLLLLAFAKDAQREMEQRLHKRLGEAAASKVKVLTFHALGRSIISSVEDKKLPLAKAAEDDRVLTDMLKDIVFGLLRDSNISEAVLSWFQSHFAVHRSLTDFSTKREYVRYVRTHEFRTLKGEKVRSFEECEIANFLYLKGVPYIYEKPYGHKTDTSEHGPYRPDFHLPEAGIYIEHWGISKSGKTRPDINPDAYRRKMDWARETHKNNGTDLVETFSHEKKAGNLTKNLEKNLAERGVKLSAALPDDFFGILREQGRITPLIRLLAAFLRQYKRARLSIEQIHEKAAVSSEHLRAKAFLQVFGPVYEAYQKRLSEKGEIDFEDMIVRATEYVETGRYTRNHGYILVDEFQDISPDRARLLKALLDKSPDNQLFAVGDDWQSIYRFAGSDTAVMRKFSGRFGVSERIDLGETFRCADGIAAAATKFILANPEQLKKEVYSARQNDGPCISIGFPETESQDLLAAALKKIEAMRKSDARASVLVLGRYSHLKPLHLPMLKKTHPGLDLSYMTVHKSKGLEADYVVVLGLCSGGKYAFPSEIDNDPLLDIVLGAPEAHRNAEERRLFYVAVTRAKHHVFLLAEGGPESVFVKELLEGGYEVNVFGRDTEKDVSCPACVEGRMVRREKDGVFYGCSNYPFCEYTQGACLHCSEGLPVKSDKGFFCRDCGEAAKMCPKCGGGLRQRRRKKDGNPFLGCSKWPDCNYTENIPDRVPGPEPPPARI